MNICFCTELLDFIINYLPVAVKFDGEFGSFIDLKWGLLSFSNPTVGKTLSRFRTGK